MCGIAGYVLRDGLAEQAVVRRMCDQIVHRGPDDQGFFSDLHCALGMRRLSIIDLSQGHQPMANEDETLWIVFNGEIYNYQELRHDLETRGHRFRTHSDTETLLHLYEEHGPDGLTQLQGMFAYALWDKRTQELFLARDRFGKKPLYYALLPQGLYFGSELKCLRTAVGVPLDWDSDALRLYFRYGYVPDPLSPYRHVKKLPAGTWLRYRQGEVQQGRYWRLPPPAEQTPQQPTESEAARRVAELFDESVRRRLIADVPLGAFLSGGIDSSLIVASMARQTREPVQTFSIGFDEAEFNELPYARMVAQQYRTDHHEVLVRPDAVTLAQRVACHCDEPFADTATVPTLLISEFAAERVKVALSGDGGDELFGGYSSFQQVQQLAWLDALPGPVLATIGWTADRLPYSTYGKNYLRLVSRRTALERYFEANYAYYYLRKNLLQPEWVLPLDEEIAFARAQQYLLPEENTPALTQALYFEATANLTSGMLVKVDRMSMAASLEVRCPLLDHELAEYAATLAHHWKMQHGQGKRILLKALGDRLPPALLRRPKQGFSVPLAPWFRTSLRDFVQDRLTRQAFLNYGFVRPTFLRQLLAEHQSGRRDNHQWLWMLLMLDLWVEDGAKPL